VIYFLKPCQSVGAPQFSGIEVLRVAVLHLEPQGKRCLRKLHISDACSASGV
jgi:hypothetical protein